MMSVNFAGGVVYMSPVKCGRAGGSGRGKK